MNSDGLNVNMLFRLPVLTLRKVENLFDTNAPEVLFCFQASPTSSIHTPNSDVF